MDYKMNYEAFKKAVSENIKRFLPESFANYEVRFAIMQKVNEEKEAFQVIPPSSEGVTMAPNLYFDDLFNNYQKDNNFFRVMHEIAELIVDNTMTNMDINVKQMISRDQIVVNLINAKKNKALLETIPHQRFLDLAIIYRAIIHENEDGMGTAIINQDCLDELNMTRAELHAIAMENMRVLFPLEILRLSNVLYVVTNTEKWNGAASILFKETQDKLVNYIKDDYYIIPSSAHEMMVAPKAHIDPQTLLSILEEANAKLDIVKPNELLGTSIYLYERKTRDFKIVATYPD